MGKKVHTLHMGHLASLNPVNIRCCFLGRPSYFSCRAVPEQWRKLL